MKLPRVLIMIMEILAALMGLMSAYGGACPAYYPERLLQPRVPGDPVSPSSIALHAVMTQYQWLFIIMNILTWVAAVATVVMIVVLILRKKWFYMGALSTAILGFVSGLIPYLMATLNGASTPSYMRTIIYGIIVLLLLIPAFRRELKDNIAVKKTETGSAKKHLPAILFFPGALIFAQLFFVAPSHDVLPNVEMYKSLQIGTGLVLMAVGILTFVITKIKELKK